MMSKAKSRWKKAGMMVRMGISMKNVINTGFEVIDGKGLPVRIVDGTTGEEAVEVMPLGCSLNLVRRTARSTFGYTRQVLVSAVPPKAPGQRRQETQSKRHLVAVEERLPIKRLAEWKDMWTEWSEKSGERRIAEVEWRVLRASGVTKNEALEEPLRFEALVDLEELVSLRANLHGVDAHMMKALSSVIDSEERSAPTRLAAAAALVVWRLAGHPDVRVTTLIWEQNLVRSLALAANAAKLAPGPGDDGSVASAASAASAALRLEGFVKSRDVPAAATSASLFRSFLKSRMIPAFL